MSKKDFEVIAEVINKLQLISDAQRLYVAREFAYRLAQVNPRFNHPKFVAACLEGI